MTTTTKTTKKVTAGTISRILADAGFNNAKHYAANRRSFVTEQNDWFNNSVQVACGMSGENNVDVANEMAEVIRAKGYFVDVQVKESSTLKYVNNVIVRVAYVDAWLNVYIADPRVEDAERKVAQAKAALARAEEALAAILATA